MQVVANDIHHYARRLELALAELSQDLLVPVGKKETIQSYVKFKHAEGLSIPRQVCYLFTLRKLSRLLGGQSFDKATKTDLVDALSAIEKEKTSYETKRTKKECIKQFYRWLKGNDEEYPPEVKWISQEIQKTLSASGDSPNRRRSQANGRVMPEHSRPRPHTSDL